MKSQKLYIRDFFEFSKSPVQIILHLNRKEEVQQGEVLRAQESLGTWWHLSVWNIFVLMV